MSDFVTEKIFFFEFCVGFCTRRWFGETKNFVSDFVREDGTDFLGDFWAILLVILYENRKDLNRDLIVYLVSSLHTYSVATEYILRMYVHTMEWNIPMEFWFRVEPIPVEYSSGTFH